jgi:predicted O-methyltransferase YrrM
MTQELWTKVDHYFNARLSGPDPALARALATSAQARLPPIAVSESQGKLLMILARAIAARRILEVGALGGYSTIHLARALPADGRLISLEIDPRHAAVAQANLDSAGLGGVASVRVGPAIDALPGLAKDEPFDLVFIDADKPSNPDYFTWAVRLTRPGGLIIVDNVVRQGAVAADAGADRNVEGVRRMTDLISGDPRVEATAIQTVGEKGYDGFLIARVI